MLMAPSTSPPSPTGDGHADGQHRPFAPSSSLNPLASPFSPSFPSDSAVEELPEWLLFSPSSLEGRSSRPSSVSSAPSSAEVARRASSSSHTAGSRSASPVVTYAGAEIPPFVHHEGKAPAVDAGPLVPRMARPTGSWRMLGGHQHLCALQTPWQQSLALLTKPRHLGHRFLWTILIARQPPRASGRLFLIIRNGVTSLVDRPHPSLIGRCVHIW
jgi:hypothetical protein